MNKDVFQNKLKIAINLMYVSVKINSAVTSQNVARGENVLNDFKLFDYW